MEKGPRKMSWEMEWLAVISAVSFFVFFGRMFVFKSPPVLDMASPWRPLLPHFSRTQSTIFLCAQCAACPWHTPCVHRIFPYFGMSSTRGGGMGMECWRPVWPHLIWVQGPGPPHGRQLAPPRLHCAPNAQNGTEMLPLCVALQRPQLFLACSCLPLPSVPKSRLTVLNLELFKRNEGNSFVLVE